MNKKILIVLIVTLIVLLLSVFAVISNFSLETVDSQYTNLGNGVMVDIGEGFELINDSSVDGISLKNNYSTIDIEYFSDNNSKSEGIILLNVIDSSSRINNSSIIKNKSTDNINNTTVYYKTFENKDNIIQLWSFKKDNFTYLISANISSETYNNEKYRLLVDSINNIISSLIQIEDS